MKAEEAHKISESVENVTAQSQISLIMTMIKKDAEKGLFRTETDKIEPRVRKHFEELGYKISYFDGSPREDGYYIISW